MIIALSKPIMYTRPVYRMRERLSPGGLRGLQIRRGALIVSSVGSTPIRSRQYLAHHCLPLWHWHINRHDERPGIPLYQTSNHEFFATLLLTCPLTLISAVSSRSRRCAGYSAISNFRNPHCMHISASSTALSTNISPPHLGQPFSLKYALI